MEYDKIKNYLGSLGIGIFLLIAGPLLIFDEEMSSILNNQDIFFYMTVILAVMLVVAGVLLIIVGVYGILDVYKKEKNN